jgi:hypothetical protein
MARTRWLTSLPNDSSIGIPFLLVLGFWLTVMFGSFGLLSPQNSMVTTVLLLCALSVAAAVFLILDLDQPLDGVIRVSSAPLRGALVQLAP